KYLNGHFGGLFVYFLHFAPKTSKRTIDDPYYLAFANLMMFSHMTIRFSYDLHLPDCASTGATKATRKAAANFKLRHYRPALSGPGGNCRCGGDRGAPVRRSSAARRQQSARPGPPAQPA